MKERKYPLFGEWLEKSRGSHSLQWIGNRIGKEHNTVSDYAKGYVKPPKLIAACLINLFNADPLEIADFLYDFSQSSERSEGDRNPPAMRVEDKRLNHKSPNG